MGPLCVGENLADIDKGFGTWRWLWDKEPEKVCTLGQNIPPYQAGGKPLMQLSLFCVGGGEVGRSPT